MIHLLGSLDFVTNLLYDIYSLLRYWDKGFDFRGPCVAPCADVSWCECSVENSLSLSLTAVSIIS